MMTFAAQQKTAKRTNYMPSLWEFPFIYPNWVFHFSTSLQIPSRRVASRLIPFAIYCLRSHKHKHKHTHPTQNKCAAEKRDGVTCQNYLISSNNTTSSY